MVQREKNSGIYISSWKEKTPEGYTTDVGLNGTELDRICSMLPKEYGAKIDHRIKRDRWIWVKPEYQVEARQYLIDNCRVKCALIEVSEDWYWHKC